MSLMIKGMDMPISCTECPCYDDMETCFCNVLDSYCEQYKTERHPDCPLAEIPTPHGDLIDRDILNECCESVINEPPTVAAICIAASIGQATPVIEAEE